MPSPRSNEESPYKDDIRTTHRNSSSNSTNEKHGSSRGCRYFVSEKGLSDEHREDFRKGAMLAQVNNPKGAFENIDLLTEDDKAVLRKKESHRWHQPFMLYFLCTLCAGSAIVQGMDQTAVNGAQLYYFREFDIQDP
ncbi:Fc.00g096270.m01.CDS01 [Cosmosporella sp. VM-42]